MYFQSRAEAGVMLASQLQNYRYENTVVVALSDGAVQVGMQIAAELHATLTMMLSEQIDIPGEGMIFGSLNQAGDFVYNEKLSDGEIHAYYSEFHGYLEDQKRVKTSKMNALMSSGGLVSEDMLRGQNVILTIDGLSNGNLLDAAEEYLKPLRIERLIIAAPIASVPAVDKAHLLADELHILAVTDNFLDTNHYYEVNDLPDHDTVIRMLNDFVLSWR
jgi:predicted phosphoribosyltransferase